MTRTLPAAAVAIALAASPALAVDNNERWWGEVDRCLATLAPDLCWQDRQAAAELAIEGWRVIRPDLVVECQRYDEPVRVFICIGEQS